MQDYAVGGAAIGLAIGVHPEGGAVIRLFGQQSEFRYVRQM
jgi:hypothetical protein